MALKSQQSVIQVLNTGVLQTVEECSNITGPDGKAKLIDVTHLLSTGKEYLSGLADFGQISLDCNFTGGTQQVYLRTLYATQAPAATFRIKIPGSTPGQFHTFTFLALVTSWSLDTKVDDKVDLKVTMQITGSVAYAPPGQSPT